MSSKRSGTGRSGHPRTAYYALAHWIVTQVGRPREYAFSVPIAAYLAATQGRPAEYRARLWEVSERLVAPYASEHSWPFVCDADRPRADL
jgi:hypothetical protein|tara:strand:- start:55 stop:324 length:270 start_codon:yes stop_codon:yes gene_type:complete